MKCLLKSLLGIDVNHETQQGGVCTEYPPIVKSLVGSALFLVLMVTLINLLVA